jgi:antitoxin MazE
MKVQVQKWGNSLAVRIPKSFTAEMNIEKDSTVEIKLQNGQITIEPIKKELILEEIFADIKMANLGNSAVERFSKEINYLLKKYKDENRELNMILFKTSGQTFQSVIENKKHAFVNPPRNWVSGMTVLLSKNKTDCLPNEKQILYTGIIKNIRPIQEGEADIYWKGTEGRWNHIVELEKVEKLSNPFNLEDILGDEASIYRPAVSFKNIEENHATLIRPFLT